jgi:hypothetical protein
MQPAGAVQVGQLHPVSPSHKEASMAFTLKINGTPHTVDVDGDAPLLCVLRDGIPELVNGVAQKPIEGTSSRWARRRCKPQRSAIGT